MAKKKKLDDSNHYVRGLIIVLVPIVFLQESKQDWDLALQNAQALANESFLKKPGAHGNNLRTAPSAYLGLQQQCEGAI